MFIKDNIQINVNEVAFFGRGVLSEQIAKLVDSNIKGYYDDFNEFEKLSKNIPLIYAVGYKNLEQKRMRLHSLLKEGYQVCSFVADNAIFSKEVILGNGVIINQGAIIDNYVKLEDGVFVNIGSSISHHSTVKECTFIGPGATIAGNVVIEQNVFVGAGSCIINDIVIGEGSVIAAGAVVTKNVAPYSLVAGVPAKFKKYTNVQKL